jgi:signal transduction histidine kinase
MRARGRRVDAFLRANTRAAYAASGVLLAAITWLDYVTGYDLGLFVLYFVPVGIAAWWGTRRAGVVVALAAAACWYGSDVLAGHRYPQAYLGYWETFMRLVSNLTMALTLSKIREVLRRQEDLLGVVSHDLKAPLGAIAGQAQMLRGREPGNPWVTARADAILRASSRMDSMIDDLVDGARHESGHLALRFERVPIRDHLLEMLSRMGAVLDAARVEVAIPERPALAVRADPARLERIMANLLSNALKYSPDDAPVTVAAERRDGVVVLSVRDRGPGVAPADMPHLFDRYYRAASTRHVEGVGLGLHSTRLLVEAHGGSIRVENGPDGGATFAVELPAA